MIQVRRLSHSASHFRRLFDLPQFKFHVGGKKEATKMYGNDDVGLHQYTKFENVAQMEASIRGVAFRLVSDNVFTLNGALFGLDLAVLNAQAGFQVWTLNS
jgi:hypothetical protein